MGLLVQNQLKKRTLKNVDFKDYWNYTRVSLNSQAHVAPNVAPKIADEVVFRHFQGEGVEFF